MESMRWKNEMSVGLKEMDDDHRFLIRVINRLGESVANPEDTDVIRECLASLRNYAEFHFAREEAVMRTCSYPTLSFSLPMGMKTKKWAKTPPLARYVASIIGFVTGASLTWPKNAEPDLH